MWQKIQRKVKRKSYPRTRFFRKIIQREAQESVQQQTIKVIDLLLRLNSSTCLTPRVKFILLPRQIVVSGRKIYGFPIESLDGQSTFELPTLLECNQIPSVRDEIPTPNVTTYYEHFHGIEIPPIDDEAVILMLIGRNLVEAHHIIDQRIGPKGTPFAQKLALGWVIIGEKCLGKVHISNHVNVNKTFVLANGRTSLCKPCTSDIQVQEHCDIAENIFIRTKDDDKIGQSVEDKEFLEIMENGFR